MVNEIGAVSVRLTLPRILRWSPTHAASWSVGPKSLYVVAHHVARLHHQAHTFLGFGQDLQPIEGVTVYCDKIRRVTRLDLPDYSV